MKHEDKIEKMINKLNKIDDSSSVNVKISFIIEVLQMLILKEYENDELYNFIVSRYQKINFYLDLGREYIDMNVSDVKFLLNETKDMLLNRNMIVVSNRGKMISK